MNKFFKYVQCAAVGVLVTVGLNSCVKDLDVEPLTPSVVTSATAWNNDTAAECFLAKIYSAFSINGQDGAGNSNGNDIIGADQGEAIRRLKLLCPCAAFYLNFFRYSILNIIIQRCCYS